MKLKYVLVAALSVAAVIGFAQESKTEKSTSSASKKISALEATNFLNKTMTVTGKVARVSVRPKITYLDIDEAYPKSPFNGIIFASATNQFPNLKDLKGKNVELTGKIADYQGKPQIVLNKSNQLVVVEKKSDDSKSTDSK